ncbi:hypothetical protein ACF0H5_015134 [Mactra antiquata]
MEWCVLVVFVMVCCVSADEFNVDMENTGVCTMSEQRLVRKQDIYNIYADPPRNGVGTRTKCNVRFIGEGGAKFKLYVRDLIFHECQVKIKMYEGGEAETLNNARYTFDCNSGTGNTYTSYYNDIVISLQKPDSESKGYKFYMRLALENGPDIGIGAIPTEQLDSGLSGGVIAGIVVGAVLVLVIIVAAIIFGVVTYRRKQDEKAVLAHSMSTLIPTGTERGGSSVHSSVHSSIHGSVHSSKHSMYPAFRSTITDKNPKCNSIDTKSYDSEAVDGEVKLKPAIKNVKHEFDSMRRGLQREKYRQEREEADLIKEEARWREAQRADKQNRAESNRGLGRSNRNRREDRMILTDENIKQSLRHARNAGRSFDDRSSRKGSTRSTRSRHKSHSPSRSHSTHRGYRTDSDYNYSEYDDDDRDRGRQRTRSQSGRSQRSSSTGMSRRHRDYDRDDYSDYDDRHSRHRHHSRERYSEDEHRSRHDRSSHRSGHQRSRSQSSGRRHR